MPGEEVMRHDVRTVHDQGVTEVHVTASPACAATATRQAEDAFTRVRQALLDAGARVVQERVFGTPEALDAAKPIRRDVYGDLDDGVEPAWLVVGQGANGPVAGVQMHAVAGAADCEIVRIDDAPRGRIMRGEGWGYLTLSGITALEAGGPEEQARRLFEKAQAALEQSGLDLLAVPRTWLWLGDILAWYDEFNAVRNRFFEKHGLLGEGVETRMPASTGIGVGPLGDAACAMDLTAVIEPAGAIEYLDTTRKQDSAFAYGSAFSRAARATTPAGASVFVSGTASIAASGETEHVGDAPAQIAATITNVRAAFNQMGCADADLVQAIAYCKTPEVERAFHAEWPDLGWPIFTAICDVCRDDLLFEIEAMAMTTR